MLTHLRLKNDVFMSITHGQTAFSTHCLHLQIINFMFVVTLETEIVFGLQLNYLLLIKIIYSIMLLHFGLGLYICSFYWVKQNFATSCMFYTLNRNFLQGWTKHKRTCSTQQDLCPMNSCERGKSTLWCVVIWVV